MRGITQIWIFYLLETHLQKGLYFRSCCWRRLKIGIEPFACSATYRTNGSCILGCDCWRQSWTQHQRHRLIMVHSHRGSSTPSSISFARVLEEYLWNGYVPWVDFWKGEAFWQNMRCHTSVHGGATPMPQLLSREQEPGGRRFLINLIPG
jgi:hypothetical protein